MKITDVDLWTVNIPYKNGFSSSIGKRAGTTRTVIRMRTDNGLEGWGETMRGGSVATLVEKYRELLIGWNPYDIEKLRLDFHMTPFFYGYVGYSALAAIEMAFYDLIGKDTGRSLSELLGGAMKTKVDMTGVATKALVPADSREPLPEAFAKATDAFRKEFGFGSIKLKGSSNAFADVENIRAARALMPDVNLRIDPNAAWSVHDSIRAAQMMLPLNLEYLEDPCAGLEGMAKVREMGGIPLCTNMCVVRLEDLAPSIRLNSVDIIHGDVHKWGGINPTKRLAAVCDAFGLGMNLHSGGEIGISTACHLHVVASTPEIRYAIDTVYYLMTDDIIKQPFKIENGAMTVPTGPGLGVEVDMEKLEHHARLTAEQGEMMY